MNQVQDARDVRRLATRFATRLDQLKEDFVGRDEAIGVVGLAALCREHVLLVGPPGTAKTALLTSFGQMLDTEPFTYLLTRFTEPAELFGPVDVKLFRDESIYRVKTDKMLPTAHLAFLDEVFEGSSAILNSLLTLINERRFFNGSEAQPSNLITLLGSTNDIPDDPVLAAFSDRFLLRGRLDYVADDDVEDVLDVGWRAERNLITNGETVQVVNVGSTEVRFSLADLAVLQRAVAAVDLGPVRDAYADIVRELRGQGVTYSDRRAVKAQKVFAASALLAGRTSAQLDNLAPMMYLWTDPRDEPTLRRVLTGNGVTVADPAHPMRDPAEIRVDHVDLQARLRAAVTEEELRELGRQLAKLDKELRRDHPGEVDLLGQVKASQRTSVLAIAERSRRDGVEASSDV